VKLGIDVDGVLANFNEKFIQRCIDVTGKDLFPTRPFDIPTWHYPQVYGYTEKEMGSVWGSVKADPSFWYSLNAYPTTQQDLLYLGNRQYFNKDEIYFITNRDGDQPKKQTEMWISEHCWAAFKPSITVLISSAKGLCAKALYLDVYIDDRHENCIDVKTRSPETKVFILDRPWNRTEAMLTLQKVFGIVRTDRVAGIAGDSLPFKN
jgi:5'(3')-deoxyribonucleotidase